MAATEVGWPTTAEGVSYPPEPWRLEGSGCVSVWRLPAAELESFVLPPGARLWAVLGQAILGTAWVMYGPGGVLAYNEVLAATRVSLRGRSFTTITHIWVDHPASIAGARALWGIPKQAALIRIDRGGSAPGADLTASATTLDGQPIASTRFSRRAGLPGRWPFRTRTVHWREGRDGDEGMRVTEARASARVELGAATWAFAPDGPLAFLNRHEPLTSARLARMSLLFGAELQNTPGRHI